MAKAIGGQSALKNGMVMTTVAIPVAPPMELQETQSNDLNSGQVLSLLHPPADASCNGRCHFTPALSEYNTNNGIMQTAAGHYKLENAEFTWIFLHVNEAPVCPSSHRTV